MTTTRKHLANIRPNKAQTLGKLVKVKNPLENPKKPPTARDRLLDVGAKLFSEQGFAGTSVREICDMAETGINMIHHYFGNKQGLYDEILTGFSDTVWLVPIRIIAEMPENREKMISRFEIFVEETLEALIANRHLYEMVVRERVVFAVFTKYNQKLVAFLEEGKTRGFIRAELDSEMLTGLILDRLGNQVLFASWVEETQGHSILTDDGYKKRWLKANLDLILNGVLA